jgi:hypothetical protein
MDTLHEVKRLWTNFFDEIKPNKDARERAAKSLLAALKKSLEGEQLVFLDTSVHDEGSVTVRVAHSKAMARVTAGPDGLQLHGGDSRVEGKPLPLWFDPISQAWLDKADPGSGQPRRAGRSSSSKT